MPKVKQIEVGKKQVDKIVKMRNFEPEVREHPHRQFYIFRWQGDQIEGILGPPVTNYRRNTSYPIQLNDGNTVEIFGNKLLHSIIRENELIGSRVKIVYIGRQHNVWGRPAKVYRVYKVQGIGLLTHKRYDEKSSKPKRRKRKKNERKN